MAALIGQLMLEEIAPTLTDLGDFDVPDYCQALLSRFANPGLEHRTAQIAMDGSQKIPQRVLPPLRLQLQRGCPGEATSLVLAARMHYLRGRDDSGRELVIDDPMAGEFARIATQHGGQHEAFLDAVLGLKNLFGNDLPRDKPLRESLLHWLRRLGDEGAAGVVAEVWGTRPTG
jgi:fructuronate reductase